MFTGPLKRLQSLVSQIDATEFNLSLFEESGVVVIRNLVPSRIINKAIEDWNRFYHGSLADRKVYKFNPVAVQEAIPCELETLYDNENVIAIAKEIFGDDVALYSFRFVIKDRFARDHVFIHNDVGYHSGCGTNVSFFIPLSVCDIENGGMTFYPGTHNFGYLGDVGELNPAILEPGWPMFIPRLAPGDVVVMNSAIWHGSAPHTSGPDRVLADVILKSARDPFYKKIVSGRSKCAYGVSDSDRIFNRSRVSRLVEYQARLDRQETHTNTKG